MGKVLIFSAPSGAGKSTIVQHLLKKFPALEFSVSATSRAPRGTETDGVDYYFLSPDQFRERIEKGDFIEWEQVYQGAFYGTLRHEVERIWNKGNIVVFDVDVVGGVNLKKIFGKEALSVFIQPPSVESLRQRLVTRGTDTMEAIEKRVAKATTELSFAPRFDTILTNDQLTIALQEAEKLVNDFITKS